jgi:hypothetical protein
VETSAPNYAPCADAHGYKGLGAMRPYPAGWITFFPSTDDISYYFSIKNFQKQKNIFTFATGL